MLYGGWGIQTIWTRDRCTYINSVMFEYGLGVIFPQILKKKSNALIIMIKKQRDNWAGQIIPLYMYICIHINVTHIHHSVNDGDVWLNDVEIKLLLLNMYIRFPFCFNVYNLPLISHIIFWTLFISNNILLKKKKSITQN